jgi:hypothetical protein
MRAQGSRLGEILERQGTLSREQLLRALRNQKVVGGKLGTCLLEIDALAEESLLKGLGEQQGAPTASPEDLRGVSDEVLAMVPPKVARAHQLVPFRATGTQLHIAMVDARDLRALDELSFVTARRVVAHVASEVRVFEALEKYYSGECPQRFAKLLDRLNRARFLWRDREEPPREEILQWDPGLSAGPGAAEENPSEPVKSAPAPAPSAPPRRPAPPPIVLPPRRSPHEFAPRVPASPEVTAPIAGLAAKSAPPPAPAAPPRAKAPPTPAPAAPAPAPASAPRAVEKRPDGRTIEGAERLLLNPEDADAVGRTLVDFAAGIASAVALFQIRKSEICGWFGEGVDPTRLASFRLDFEQPSLFVALRDGAALHRGPLPDLAAHQELHDLFGAAGGADLTGLPLRVRDRLVAVLLVAPASGAHPTEALPELQRIVAKASIALELCIMRKKLRKA